MRRQTVDTHDDLSSVYTNNRLPHHPIIVKVAVLNWLSYTYSFSATTSSTGWMVNTYCAYGPVERCFGQRANVDLDQGSKRDPWFSMKYREKIHRNRISSGFFPGNCQRFDRMATGDGSPKWRNTHADSSRRLGFCFNVIVTFNNSRCVIVRTSQHANVFHIIGSMCTRIHQSSMDSLKKGQQWGALMLSLSC